MAHKDINQVLLKCFSEVGPIALLEEGQRFYKGMNDFDAYQSGGVTYFRDRKTGETYRLTALIKTVGKTKVVKAKDHVYFKRMEDDTEIKEEDGREFLACPGCGGHHWRLLRASVFKGDEPTEAECSECEEGVYV